MFAPRPAPLLRPPCLGDADRVRLRESVNSREVRHSLTWHSSKSESALERFEPVAADKLRLDGSLAMFAPEGDGCLNRARREEAGRIHKAGTTLCDFWYFWSYKSTIKEKLLYVSIRRQQATALRTKSKYSQHTKRKIYTSFRRRTHLIHARPSFSSGRAGNACTNLLDFFV